MARRKLPPGVPIKSGGTWQNLVAKTAGDYMLSIYNGSEYPLIININNGPDINLKAFGYLNQFLLIPAPNTAVTFKVTKTDPIIPDDDINLIVQLGSIVKTGSNISINNIAPTNIAFNVFGDFFIKTNAVSPVTIKALNLANNATDIFTVSPDNLSFRLFNEDAVTTNFSLIVVSGSSVTCDRYEWAII